MIANDRSDEDRQHAAFFLSAQHVWSCEYPEKLLSIFDSADIEENLHIGLADLIIRCSSEFEIADEREKERFEFDGGHARPDTRPWSSREREEVRVQSW